MTAPPEFKTSSARALIGLILLCAALALFSLAFSGCASTGASGVQKPTMTAAAAPLVFEIVHQRRMGMPGIETGWVDNRVGHILNNRTIAVHVTIDCDLSYWTPVDVAARTKDGPGEQWFLLRPEDRTCVVSRVKKE